MNEHFDIRAALVLEETRDKISAEALKNDKDKEPGLWIPMDCSIAMEVEKETDISTVTFRRKMHGPKKITTFTSAEAASLRFGTIVECCSYATRYWGVVSRANKNTCELTIFQQIVANIEKDDDRWQLRSVEMYILLLFENFLLVQVTRHEMYHFLNHF